MKLLGFEIRRLSKSLSPPDAGRWTLLDHYTGAFQQDVPLEMQDVLHFSVVFACVRLIATDIGKLGIDLMETASSGIKVSKESADFSPLLRKPNHYQTRIKFIEQWVISKLMHGNAYALKERGPGGNVRKLFVIHPERVTPLVSEQGEVFYRVNNTKLAGVIDQVVVPATEMIHDVHITPYHPLVGMSNLSAAGLAARHGLKIQNSQSKFFTNMARPSGMLSAPGSINQATAERLKTEFSANYSGENIGSLAVAGDGLEFKAFSLNAVDAQVIEQLKFTGEDIARAFGVPGYKVGVGQMPTQNNIAALNQSYYDDCLQELIACIELSLKEGLELPAAYSVHMDLNDLLRMDSTSRNSSYETAIRAGWKSPNEVRLRENLPPVEGGEEPIMQQQNWPLSVLKQRAPPGTGMPAQAETAAAFDEEFNNAAQ